MKRGYIEQSLLFVLSTSHEEYTAMQRYLLEDAHWQYDIYKDVWIWRPANV